MTEMALPADTYRHLDRATKLGGLALVAAGLEVGGSSPEGIALAIVGSALAVVTVFITEKHE